MENSVVDLTPSSLDNSTNPDGEEEYNENEFNALMKQYLNLQTQHYFLEKIMSESQEEWPSVITMAESLAVARCTLQNGEAELKNAVSDLCSEDAENVPKVDKEKLLESQKLTQAIKQWKEDQTSLNELFKDDEQEMTNTTRFYDDIMQTKLALEALEEKIEDEKSERQKLDDHMYKLNAKLAVLHENMPSQQEHNKSVTAKTGCENLSMSEMIMGYGSNKIDDDTVELVAVQAGDSCVTAPQLRVQLPVEYVKNNSIDDPDKVIVKAEYYMQNMAKEMMCKSKCSTWHLLMKLHLTWTADLPLTTEIEALKSKKHGVDWLADKRELHVLVGDGKDVCLHVKPEYPQPSSVQIVNIKGRGSDKISIDELQEAAPIRVADWVLYLQENIQ